MAAQDGAPERPPLALMGTVPIYWGEAEGLGDLLAPRDSGHWARPVLERQFRLVPLDYLSADALAAHRVLLMAQPRALSAEENVALDAWVRDGGRVLLLADPMMTGESRFALGDRRRPQDVALLSPILAHWGLELRFDDAQEPGMQRVAAGGLDLPVNLPGQWHLLPDGACIAVAGTLVSRCSLGAGEALLVADAAMLDFDGPAPGAEVAIESLLALLGVAGEIVHPAAASSNESLNYNNMADHRQSHVHHGEGRAAPP